MNERQALYQAMSPQHLTPLWESLHSLVPKEPRTPCVPHLWAYQDVLPFLMKAGSLISAQEAVRRGCRIVRPSSCFRYRLSWSTPVSLCCAGCSGASDGGRPTPSMPIRHGRGAWVTAA
mgnify:CR=1 FL=1